MVFYNEAGRNRRGLLKMNVEVAANRQEMTSGFTCARCGKNLSHGKMFSFKSAGSRGISAGAGQGIEITKCFGCALQHEPMLKRSLAAALVVGTVLTLLNQGDTLLSGNWNNALVWKIPLTYCVPMLVATYGALTNSRK
jgi:hypothetical protein